MDRFLRRRAFLVGRLFARRCRGARGGTRSGFGTNRAIIRGRQARMTQSLRRDTAEDVSGILTEATKSRGNALAKKLGALCNKLFASR